MIGYLFRYGKFSRQNVYFLVLYYDYGKLFFFFF